MSHPRSTRFLILALSAFTSAACEEPPPTSVELRFEQPEDGPLRVSTPALSDVDPVARQFVRREPPAGPALESWPEDQTTSFAMITNEQSGAYFGSGFAAASGRHDYTGNIGRVETTAHVTFKDQHLGSQSAARQDYTPFLLDFGRTKSIWVRALVYTDHTCGLSVQGESKHFANWQFFLGADVPTWGHVSRASQRRPSTQGACGTITSNRDPTGFDRPAEGMTCTYLITYDLRTLEVVDVEKLYCSTTGELI